MVEYNTSEPFSVEKGGNCTRGSNWTVFRVAKNHEEKFINEILGFPGRNRCEAFSGMIPISF